MTRIITILCLAIFVACNLGILTPKTGPDTEYPCGVDGMLCNGDSHNPVCCPAGMVCCDGTTCHKDQCVFIGAHSKDGGVSHD